MFYTSLNLAIMYNCGRIASAYSHQEYAWNTP